jgi:hypothetical protein
MVFASVIGGIYTGGIYTGGIYTGACGAVTHPRTLSPLVRRPSTQAREMNGYRDEPNAAPNRCNTARTAAASYGPGPASCSSRYTRPCA